MTSTKSFKPLSALNSNDNVLINFTQRIGDWAHGSIYRGFSKTLAKKVMVKVIDLNKLPLPPSFIDNEVNILKKLQENKNVTKLIEEQTNNNTRTIVTELCEHGTLRTLLQEHGPMSEERALKLLLNIIKGLRGVHENKFCHGSLRPENIFLYQNPDNLQSEVVPKLTNFTFSRPYSSGPVDKSHLPQDISYMAPEVLKSLRYNPKSDLWSLGMIYYEMLYGVLPFSGSTKKALETSIIGPQLEFSTKNTISEASITFLQKCLERSPLKRLDWSELSQQRILFKSLFGDEDDRYNSQKVDLGLVIPLPATNIVKKVESETPKAKAIPGHSSSKSMSIMNFNIIPRFNKTLSKAHRRQMSTVEDLNERSSNLNNTMTSSIIGYSSVDQYSINFKDDNPLTDRQLTLPLDQSIISILPEKKRIGTAQSKSRLKSRPSLSAKPVPVVPIEKPQPQLQAQSSPIMEVLKTQTAQFYENIVAHIGNSGDYNLAKMNASRSGNKTTSNNSFSLPFKWLSYKAEILNQIYQLAVDNKDYPLYEKIMNTLEEEVSKLNSGLSQIDENRERSQTEVDDLSKRRSTLDPGIRAQTPQKSQKKNLVPSTKGVKKQSLVKKEKSKKIYELLKEILKTLLTHGKKNVNNEDIVKIAANFKVFREFEQIGDNVVRDLESLKDIMLVFYRKKHYDHLKYLLLVKNLV